MTIEPETANRPEWAGTCIPRVEYCKLESFGGNLDVELPSGSFSMALRRGSSSSSASPSSSDDMGVEGRRGGGSFSPKAMVRVGGGGSRFSTRSVGIVASDALSGSIMGRNGNRGGVGSSLIVGVRRIGSGGGSGTVEPTGEAVDLPAV